jgi:hypothetical protein
LPDPSLVTKKLIAGSGACAAAIEPNASDTADAAIAKPGFVIVILRMQLNRSACRADRLPGHGL